MPPAKVKVKKNVKDQACAKQTIVQVPRQIPVPKASSKLFYGSDCSGLDAGALALGRLSPFGHLFASEVDPSYRKVFQETHPTCKIVFEDCLKKRNLFPIAQFMEQDPKDVLVYTSGFPCQPYSRQGLRQGQHDQQGRAQVVWGCLDAIQQTKPTFFVLENVADLARASSFDGIFRDILDMLNLIGNGLYTIHWTILDSYEVGNVPASRERVYIVGVRKDRQVRSWDWPQPIRPPPLDRILVPRSNADKIALTSLSDTALRNVNRAIQIIMSKKGRWYCEPWVVDLMPAASFGTNVTYNKLPTITKSHAAGLWLMHKQDKVRREELLAAQGIRSGEVKIPAAVADGKIFEMIGNSFTATVLERLFSVLLPAVGFNCSGRSRCSRFCSHAQVDRSTTCHIGT